MENVIVKRERPKFAKGNPGRPKGAKNKLTITVRDAILSVFNELQDDPRYSLMAWAKKNQKDFYVGVATKLIPVDIQNHLTKDITIRVMPLEIKEAQEPSIIDIPHEIIKETD
jgi:hypothetical protein